MKNEIRLTELKDRYRVLLKQLIMQGLTERQARITLNSILRFVEVDEN